MFWTKMTDERADAILREEGARKHAEWLAKDRANIELLRKMEREIKNDHAWLIARRGWRVWRRGGVLLLLIAAYGIGYFTGEQSMLPQTPVAADADPSGQ
jgi:hypothetical protein